jgi:sulfur-oxidizing protein SoxY
MSFSRRLFLKAGAVTGSLAILSTSLLSRIALAEFPQVAFDATEYEAALKGIIGDETPEDGHVNIEANDIAENGATVPVQVSTDLSNAESITLFVEKNPRPWIATQHFHGKAMPFVSTRIKMRETSDVVAIVKADGKLYMGKKTIKVTAGGCA